MVLLMSCVVRLPHEREAFRSVWDWPGVCHGTGEYSHAWQNYGLCEQMFDGSIHPKILV
jgi:hypothetical protein